eukprot:9499598-Pyramimonas_sp.AAC.1
MKGELDPLEMSRVVRWLNKVSTVHFSWGAERCKPAARVARPALRSKRGPEESMRTTRHEYDTRCTTRERCVCRVTATRTIEVALRM